MKRKEKHEKKQNMKRIKHEKEKNMKRKKQKCKRKKMLLKDTVQIVYYV